MFVNLFNWSNIPAATNLDKTVFFIYSMGVEGGGGGGGAIKGLFSNEIFFHSKTLSDRLTF